MLASDPKPPSQSLRRSSLAKVGPGEVFLIYFGVISLLIRIFIYLIALIPDGRTAFELSGFDWDFFCRECQVVRTCFHRNWHSILFGLSDKRNRLSTREMDYVTRNPVALENIQIDDKLNY